MNRIGNCVAICFVLLVPELVPASTNAWIATWATSPQSGTPKPREPLLSIDDQTVRERLRASVGGSQIRLRFSNEFGSSPLNRRGHCGDPYRRLEHQGRIDAQRYL